MPIPTRNECYALIHQMAMPPHIVAHSFQVCRVAEILADALMHLGVSLTPALVSASALLHDITKARSFDTGENHSETGDVLLSERGHVRVGDIVRQHVRLDAYDFQAEPTEAVLVNYADKRVLHDQVVSLDRRMAYIRDRYGQTPAHLSRIDDLWRLSTEMERRIFRNLPFAPADLPSMAGDVRRSRKWPLSAPSAAGWPEKTKTAECLP